MRRLPETDLARIAPLPHDQRRRELEQMRDAFPPHSYKPVRRCSPDVLNVNMGPLAVLPRTPWASVAQAIRSEGRFPEEIEANLRVAEGLFNFAEAKEIVGRKQDFLPLAIGVSEKVTYWLPAVISVDGRSIVPFIDPRRTRKLTSEGRRFAFAVAHERIRAVDPDYAEVAFGIFQFSNTDEGPRHSTLHLDDGVELFDFDALDTMVRETYELWREVLNEREAAARRAGGTGSLL